MHTKILYAYHFVIRFFLNLNKHLKLDFRHAQFENNCNFELTQITSNSYDILCVLPDMITIVNYMFKFHRLYTVSIVLHSW